MLITRRRYFLVLGAFAAAAAFVVLAAPAIGQHSLDVLKALRHWFAPPETLSVEEAQQLAYLQLRLPRVALAFLAGGALALVGAAFQALLRNPLATPYTLGVASGGSLGATLAFYLSGTAFARLTLPLLTGPWAAFSVMQLLSLGGSLLVMAFIYALARSGSRISTMGLLLAGVTLGLICSAAIMALRYLSEPELLVVMDRWLMGGLDVSSWRDVWPMLPLLLPGVALLLWQARRYDQISYGEELAAGRGVDVGRLQKLTFFGGSLVTAAVVAVAGPIGFVGLIVPHTVRRIVGPDHRLLLPCALLAGGAFLVVCDTAARSLFPPHEIPVGIFTALLGGPFFLILLVRRGGGEGRF